MLHTNWLQKVGSLGLAYTLLTIAVPVPSALAQMQTSQYSQTQTMTQQQSYTIPAGTVLSIRETGFAGANEDIFVGQLVNPIRVNGAIVVPAGSSLQGQVLSANPSGNMRTIQLNSLTLPTGNVLAFNSSISAPMPSAQAAVREQPLSGQVTQTGRGLAVLYPTVTIGPQGVSPAAKIIGGTLGGAALGAATGTLTGLTIGATSKGRLYSRGVATPGRPSYARAACCGQVAPESRGATMTTRQALLEMG